MRAAATLLRLSITQGISKAKANAAAPLASDNTESALPIVPADSFLSRRGVLQ